MKDCCSAGRRWLRFQNDRTSASHPEALKRKPEITKTSSRPTRSEEKSSSRNQTQNVCCLRCLVWNGLLCAHSFQVHCRSTASSECSRTPASCPSVLTKAASQHKVEWGIILTLIPSSRPLSSSLRLTISPLLPSPQKTFAMSQNT
jgi:hypothetical protein